MKRFITTMALATLIAISAPSMTHSDSIAIADDVPSAKPVIVIPAPKVTVKAQYMQYYVMVATEFQDAPDMVKIAQAESSFNPTNKNPNSSASGLFQIVGGTWKNYSCKGSVIDSEDNIECARKIYSVRGTKDWDASKDTWSKM